MPKEKNKDLNPYYLELLKYMVVFKFKNRLSLNLSSEDRSELANELNEYNTKDSLNRIFSQGGKRRQNFNKSNLKGLCNYVGYDDWDNFLKIEYRHWAEELEEKLYNELDSATRKKINRTIFIRILQEIESKIIEGLNSFFKLFIKNENEGISDADLNKKLESVFRIFNLCIDYIARKQDEAHIMLIYKVAENIDDQRFYFEGFKLPNIFLNELNSEISAKDKSNRVDEIIRKIDNPLNKEVIRLYRAGNTDDDIFEYLKIQGIAIKPEEIKQIRWKSAEHIYNQLKTQKNGSKLLEN